MSKRNWVAATALGLALATGALAQGNPEAAGQQDKAAPARQQDATPEPGYADRLLTAIERIEPAVRELIAEEDKVAAEAESRRNQADLEAQQEMALWAFLMFISSAVSVVLTGVGVFLLLRTLHYTRDAAIHAGRAVDEAKNATKAAQDTIAETKRIGEAQVRAYITVLSGFTPHPPGKGKMGIYLRMTNHGQSPAFDVEIENKVVVVNQMIEDLPPFEPMARRVEAIPNGEFRDTIVDLEEIPEFFERMDRGEIITYNYGMIRYRDVFGNDRQTKYRLRCYPQRAMGGFLFGVDGDGIQMT